MAKQVVRVSDRTENWGIYKPTVEAKPVSTFVAPRPAQQFDDDSDLAVALANFHEPLMAFMLQRNQQNKEREEAEGMRMFQQSEQTLDWDDYAELNPDVKGTQHMANGYRKAYAGTLAAEAKIAMYETLWRGDAKLALPDGTEVDVLNSSDPSVLPRYLNQFSEKWLNDYVQGGEFDPLLFKDVFLPSMADAGEKATGIFLARQQEEIAAKLRTQIGQEFQASAFAHIQDGTFDLTTLENQSLLAAEWSYIGQEFIANGGSLPELQKIMMASAVGIATEHSEIVDIDNLVDVVGNTYFNQTGGRFKDDPIWMAEFKENALALETAKRQAEALEEAEAEEAREKQVEELLKPIWQGGGFNRVAYLRAINNPLLNSQELYTLKQRAQAEADHARARSSAGNAATTAQQKINQDKAARDYYMAVEMNKGMSIQERYALMQQLGMSYADQETAIKAMGTDQERYTTDMITGIEKAYRVGNQGQDIAGTPWDGPAARDIPMIAGVIEQTPELQKLMGTPEGRTEAARLAMGTLIKGGYKPFVEVDGQEVTPDLVKGDDGVYRVEMPNRARTSEDVVKGIAGDGSGLSLVDPNAPSQAPSTQPTLSQSTEAGVNYTPEGVPITAPAPIQVPSLAALADTLGLTYQGDNTAQVVSALRSRGFDREHIRAQIMSMYGLDPVYFEDQLAERLRFEGASEAEILQVKTALQGNEVFE